MKKTIVFGALLPGDPHKKIQQQHAIDLPDHEVRTQEELEAAMDSDGVGDGDGEGAGDGEGSGDGAHAVLTLLSHRVDEAFLDRHPSLEIVSNYAVGYNNIDVEAATRRGVVVTNTPDVLTETTADLAWALLMATARRLVEADAFTRAGKFQGWAPSLYLGHDIWGKTLGVVGFGRIGQAAARRAHGFGMKVVYHDPSVELSELDGGLRVEPVSLERLLGKSDFVTIHCPLLPATRHLIGAQQLTAMKPSAILINTARGPIVDEKALVSALQEGRIAGAGLDVYEEEPKIAPGLLELPQVVLAPHIGSGSAETRAKMAHMAVDAVADLFSGERPKHVINPEAWEAWEARMSS